MEGISFRNVETGQTPQFVGVTKDGDIVLRDSNLSYIRFSPGYWKWVLCKVKKEIAAPEVYVGERVMIVHGNAVYGINGVVTAFEKNRRFVHKEDGYIRNTCPVTVKTSHGLIYTYICNLVPVNLVIDADCIPPVTSFTIGSQPMMSPHTQPVEKAQYAVVGMHNGFIQDLISSAPITLKEAEKQSKNLAEEFAGNEYAIIKFVKKTTTKTTVVLDDIE